MSDEKIPGMEELMAMLKNQMNDAAEESDGWAVKKRSAPADIQGVSIPISIQTDSGKLRVYLHFPGEAASSPATLMVLVDSLLDKGMPLDVWKAKGDWGSKKKGWG